jgi:hypothetical protein
MGFSYLFEYIVLNIFHGYKYKPRVIRKNYLDNIFGAVFSQGVIIPFTALFLTAFKVKWKIRTFFILYFYLVENLFIKMGIYKVHWWRPLFTVMSLPVLFQLSDRWHKLLKKGIPSVQFITLFLTNLVTRVNLLFLLALRGKIRFGRGLFHSWKEHFIAAPLYAIVLELFSAWSLRRGDWVSIVRTLLFNVSLDIYLFKTGTVSKKFVWPWFSFILHIVMIFFSTLYQKLIYTGIKSEVETDGGS